MKELEGMRFPETAEEMINLIGLMSGKQRQAMLTELVWNGYHPDKEEGDRVRVLNKAYQSAVLVPVTASVVFELIYEDLTHLGGPMGSEYTTEKSMGLFKTADKAKVAAQENWSKGGKRDGELTWLDKDGGFRTPDLGFVMYHIEAREIK